MMRHYTLLYYICVVALFPRVFAVHMLPKYSKKVSPVIQFKADS